MSPVVALALLVAIAGVVVAGLGGLLNRVEDALTYWGWRGVVGSIAFWLSRLLVVVGALAFFLGLLAAIVIPLAGVAFGWHL